MAERKEIIPIRPPSEWDWSLKVEQIEGTRWYVEYGPMEDFRKWFQELARAMNKGRQGQLIPLQWVPSYVGVSRPAVQKRASSGGLTVFSFIVTEYTKTILGKVKYRESKQRFDVVPVKECDQWREILLAFGDFRGDR